MIGLTQELNRRAALRAAGVGMAAAGLGARAAQGAAQGAAVSDAAMWDAEYTAQKGDVSLAVYRKRLGAPQPGEAPKPVLFLVHGSSYSAKPAFDLWVGGKPSYSVMHTFAAYGYDVWTVDHENYGRSARTDSNSDIASGAEDLKAAIELAVRKTGVGKVHMYGQSSGALRAGVYAMARPDRVDRLILGAFTYKGEGSPTLTERAKQLEFYRANNRRKRDRDMIRSIFTRDRSGTADPAVAEALADAELQFGEEVPSGTYLDMSANLPLVHPDKVLSPVLLIRGEYDGIATLSDVFEFYGKLPNGDRQIVLLPGTAHSVSFGYNRHQFWHAMQAFLTMPPPASA